MVSEPEIAIFFKFEEISELRGGNWRKPHKQFQTCYAQGVIDAEIEEKGYLWT